MNKDDSNLSREELYLLVAQKFEIIENRLLNPNNKDFVISIFKESANIAKVIENYINSDEIIDFIAFDEIIKKTINEIKNESFREYLLSNILKKTHDNMKRGSINYKMIITSIIKDISSYQNKMIQNSFKIPFFEDNNEIKKKEMPQTFLSYAYYDAGLSIGLYIYFLINGGFLYVNWMWSGVNSGSSITKKQLECELMNSKQLLFLRTMNSEIDYYGNGQIRQWCSWEIGNYYTKNKEEKYYTCFYDASSKNDLLLTFKPFKYVKNGVINKL